MRRCSVNDKQRLKSIARGPTSYIAEELALEHLMFGRDSMVPGRPMLSTGASMTRSLDAREIVQILELFGANYISSGSFFTP